MHGIAKALGFTLTATLLATRLAAAAADPTQDDWPELDWDTPPPTPYDDTLAILTSVPPADIYRVRNDVIIQPDSLKTGRITIIQCHENIDAVPDLQIVYRKGSLGAPRIVQADGTGKAWVEGHSVQLKDIEHGARVCVQLSKQMHENVMSEGYKLFHGPFFRQFLDGYYAMQVIHRIRYPAELAQVRLLNGEEIEGVEIADRAGEFAVNAHFAGKLSLDFRVRPVDGMEESN